MVKELDALLRPCPVDYRYAIHEGAQHGYALPNRDIFDPRGAARDWEQIFAMFHRRIPPYAGKLSDRWTGSKRTARACGTT